MGSCSDKTGYDNVTTSDGHFRAKSCEDIPARKKIGCRDCLVAILPAQINLRRWHNDIAGIKGSPKKKQFEKQEQWFSDDWEATGVFEEKLVS